MAKRRLLAKLDLLYNNLNQERNTMPNKLDKLAKVNESITINRYDNGWMVEVGGRNKKEDWANIKTLCNTEEELIAVVKEWNSKELET